LHNGNTGILNAKRGTVMPTDEELRVYAQSLPAIYREILAAFQRIEPTRKAGYGLGFQTLASDFESSKLAYALSDIIQACDQLEQHGLVEIKHRVFVHPTEYGERLIEAMTGRKASLPSIPPLPPPPALAHNG
jgi:hypothetical protein